MTLDVVRNHISKITLKFPEICQITFPKAAHIKNIEIIPCEFDIDYVITWVNHEDKNWQNLYAEYCKDEISDSNSLSRYHNKDELKYLLRSLDENAPWIRRIYIVSNCCPPKWLNVDNNKIHWVFHEQIFNEDELPTFNSHAIESKLQKIEGLTNYFIYSNDDVFLARPVSKEDFFLSNGLSKIRLEPFASFYLKNKYTTKKSLPSHINAAINSKNLLKKLNINANNLHMHTPFPLRKDVLIKIEKHFSEEFKVVGKNAFRSIDDISTVSFLYHHYAYDAGMGIQHPTPCIVIQQNKPYTKIFNFILKNKKYFVEKLPITFCVNDGLNSHLDDVWICQITDFLNKYFPKKSIYEK